MRKLLLFLVLLGIGLAVLAWLEEDPGPLPDPRGAGPPRAKINYPPEGVDQGVSLGGHFTGRVYDSKTNRAVLRVESEDSGTRGTEDIFVDMTLEMLDPESGEVQAEVQARRARIRRTGERPEFEPRHEARVFLEDVKASFLSGLPIVPLTVTTSAAVLDATNTAARTLSSLEAIEISSDRLVGGGRGFLCNLDDEVIVIRGQGRVEFRDEESVSVRLSSLERGPLQIYHEEGAEPRPVRIEAWEGARLQILGESASTLDATHIMARGVGTENEGEAFQVRALEADGNVVWVFGDNEFRGDRATMEFDTAGELVRARLEGPPTSAKLALEREGAGLAEVKPEDLGTIQVFGNKSIVITRDQRTNFDVDGPATVETQGFRLRSNGTINGWLALDGASASFVARGGVVLEGELADLETAEFELTLTREEGDVENLRGLARGGARLEGTLADGRGFTASTPEELEVLRIGESLQIVRGTRVELAVDEPNGFRARADRIQDVDLARLFFTAEGNVEVDSQDGSSRGHKLVAEGPGKYTLSGSAERRARFENLEGWAEAMTVEADGGRLHARGNVEADLTSGTGAESLDEPAYQRYRMTGDDLVLVRTESRDEAADTTSRTFDLTMFGAVKARVRAGTENTELDCEHLIAKRVETFSGSGVTRKRLSSDSELLATGRVDGRLSLQAVVVDLKCDDLRVTGRERDGEEPYQQAVATGNVTFVGASRIDFRGRGELLIMDTDRVGRLEAPGAGRVELAGVLPSFQAPFRMTAEHVEFEGDNLRAVQPEFRVGGSRAKGDLLVTTPELLQLTGSARLSGTSRNHLPWTMDADSIDLRGRAGIDESAAELSTIDARGNVAFRLGTLIVANGDSLSRDRTGIMRLTGSPANMKSEVVEYEADWIEFDPDLQIIRQTGKGRVRPGPKIRAQNAAREGSDPIRSYGPKPLPQEEDDQGWGLEFLSSSTLVEPDSLVYVLQEPVFQYELEGVPSTMRASWTVLWIDRQGWLDLPRRLDEDPGDLVQVEPTQKVAGPMGLFFHFIEKNGIHGLVREAYFEGPVEVLSDGDVVAHADAIYLNVSEGHGWLANATVNILGKHLGQDFEQITVKADWLRHSADGSLHADQATVTPCEFADPHTKIVTGDLRITPLEGQSRFHMDVKENRIELFDLPAIPLPPLSFDTDENLRPFWPSLSIGNSARFGALFGVKFGGSSKVVADAAQKATGKKERQFDANYEVEAEYLGSRGGLLDVGFELKSKQRYWFELWTGIVYDTGEDKGYVRVPEDDREDIRLWLRGLNTVQLGKSRVTLAFSDQSDEGVQSEFWESDFVRYEQNRTFLQWKRPSNNTYTEVTAKVRTDGFISDVEELPAGSVFTGRAPVFDIAGYSVIHTGQAQAAYLRRRQGSNPVSPFGLPATFVDGLGDREVLRVDTTQELEVPIPLGVAGLKLIPFVGVQAAAWDEAVDEEDSASRVVAEAGVRLGTTFWKLSPDGKMHSISPFLMYSNEVASTFNETPVVFSALEREVFGDFIQLGTRARFGIEEGRSGFDLDINATYASSRSDGKPDGWLPLEVFGRLDISPFRQLLEIWYDTRYDIEEGDTRYSLFAIGSRGGENLEDIGWQVSHNRARDYLGQPLFEAASVAGFYRWTEKWEFEGSQSFSLLQDQDLGFRILVRRYGHDLIFEVETAFREGEGSSFGINFSPRLGYRPSKVGYLSW